MITRLGWRKGLARLFGNVLVVSTILWCAGASTGLADDGTIAWSTPVNLSNTFTYSQNPAIVADRYGYVHLFWSEDVGGDPADPVKGGNTIMYRRWDGTHWTESVDVLISPNDDDLADYFRVTLDRNSRLHAVWTGQTSLYYSSAPSNQAGSGNAWSKPIAISALSARSPWPIAITSDQLGVIHLVYAIRGTDAGVYYIQSADDGLTWSSAIRLSGARDNLEKSFSHVQIVAAGDKLHVVWETNQIEGYGQGIYYVRSTDSGQTWSESVRLAYRAPNTYAVEWPYLIAKSDSELHLIYGDSPHPERYQITSLNAGQNWLKPMHIIDTMEGTTGYTVPVIDSAGQMHLIIDMRTKADQTNGIYYARWLNGYWSPVTPIDTSIPSSHYTTAVVRLGNEIHIAWTDLAQGEIWEIHGAINNAPRLAAVPPPLPTEVVGRTPTAEATASQAARSIGLPTPAPLAAGTAEPAPSMPYQSLIIAACVTVVSMACLALVNYLSHRSTSR